MLSTKRITELETICTQTRRDILRMVHAVQSGHPGGSLGCTEFFIVLYHEILNHKPKSFSIDPQGEDAFILSNGHISPVFYSTLARSGYFEINELSTFRKLNSRLQGHPAIKEKLEGIRVASGSLGQGLSVALGIALAKKRDGDKELVYVLCGDGELQEGQIWEALMFATHNQLDNLILTIDLNQQQIDGSTLEIMGFNNIPQKLKAFGWSVIEEKNGNAIPSVYSALKTAQRNTFNGKPQAIVLHTEMGNGVDFMMGSHQWHGIAPSDEQLENALKQNPETELKDY